MIPEDTEIIANFNSLIGPQVHVHGTVLPKGILVVLTGHYHGHGFAADGGKMIKRGGFLERRHGALLVRQHNVPPLHVVAGEDDLGNGYLGLHADYAHLSRVDILRAHGLHQLVLPLEPGNVTGVVVGPYHEKAITDAHPVVLSVIDVHVIPAGESQLVIGLLAGNDAKFLRELLVGHKARAIHRVVVGRGYLFRSSTDLLGGTGRCT